VNGGLGNKLVVTQQGSPNMSVIVRSGLAEVPGTEGTKQGVYTVLNDADFTVAITAAHATLARIDSIVFKVEDQQYSGVNNTSSMVAIAGTPSGSPAPPTLPFNCIELARVAVGANVTTIVTANITDMRRWLSQGIIPCTSTTRPPANTIGAGQIIYESDTDLLYITHDSTTWVPLADAGRNMRREVSVTNSLTNPTAYTVLPQAADRTALTIASFVKGRASTRLLLSVSGALNLASGVAQNLYIGIRVGVTDYDAAQFKFTVAPTHLLLSGHGEVVGLAAGTYTIEPVIKSAGAALVTLTAGEDFISYSVIEAV
jgi:hypothetical protein